MNDALQHLCEVFEDELERQENVLRLCTLQEEAIRQRQPELLAARTQALNAVLYETAYAEQARLAAAYEAVCELQLQAEVQSLSGVIAASPEPWRSRLADVQRRLREVMHTSALIVRKNNRLLRCLMQTTQGTLRALGAGSAESAGYTVQGYNAHSHGAADVRLLNRAG